uniref:hypothetical protein n=1 Tax=Campylobacter concisus TaxID=199 RepID=UPI00215612C3
MKQLAIIIFFITSLYSHEANCTDMFGLIFNKNLSDTETAKYIKYYIDDLGCDANASLATSIGMSFAFFFRENGVGIDNKKASSELLEFIKTQKYKEFKDDKFRLIKKLLLHGQDPKDYEVLKVILKIINDEKDLDNLLKNETQKELA